MARVAVVGGNGKVARLLHPLLVRAGHTPVALVRDKAYGPELEALGAEVRLLDIERETSEEFARAFAGCRAVVFSAGAGADGKVERKRTVDLEGTLKSIEGAQQAGISRFVQLSAMGVDKPLPDDTSEVWAAYVAAKRDSDAAVRASGLDWTIVRPGALTDDPGTGLVEIAPEVERGQVPRADVAAIIARSLDTGDGLGAQFELVGGSTPIAPALEAIAAQSARPE